MLAVFPQPLEPQKYLGERLETKIKKISPPNGSHSPKNNKVRALIGDVRGGPTKITMIALHHC